MYYITGVGGFIAYHIAKYFLELGHDVVGIDKMTYCSSKKSIEDLEKYPRFTFKQIDICDISKIRQLLQEKPPTYILHLAAYTHVDNSFGNSLEFTKNNVEGTHVLLECVKNLKLELFIYMSTDEVYGENEGDDSSERDLLIPTNPYAATKAASEMLVHSYHKSFKLPTIIVRANNAYGTAQYPEKLIPKFISLLRDGKKCTIANPKAVRNFVHVKDIAFAFEVLIARGHTGQTYNIGTKNSFSVLDIYEKLCFYMQKNRDTCKEAMEDRPFNDIRYAISSEKIEALGWHEKVNFDQGLQDVIRWYLKDGLNYW